MSGAPHQPEHHMQMLSRLLVRAYCENGPETSPEDLEQLKRDLRYVSELGREQLADFLELANTNHVVVRALTILQNAAAALDYRHLADWCEICLANEKARIAHGIEMLQSVCAALEARGCKITVIKSLDHWPDLGSDLDLYTTADERRVEQVMREEFDARPVQRSWGDRLAHKWNYRVPGLPELIEVHVQYLGQTGEHAQMAKRVVERRVRKVVGGREFHVPAPEERIVISTLQRVYRHFYFRLCDMIDMTLLMQTEALDFNELRKAAEVAGIWPGVATFLHLIQSYIKSYGGDVPLPQEVIAAAYSRGDRVRFGNGFLRVSKFTGAGLYGSQLMHAGRRRDLRALLRLPLLPPLAVSALVAHGLTGNDKGIW